MKSKVQTRKEIQDAMLTYFAKGGCINKIPSKRRQYKEPKVEVVEIEVEYLPQVLRQKYFLE